CLEPVEPLPVLLKQALRRLGVQVDVGGEIKLPEQVCCWHQMLPAVPDAAPASLAKATPVLFELDDIVLWPRLLGEVCRLGTGQAGFSWSEAGPSGHVLVRMVGPPQYSVLRARDREEEGLSAYIEQAPRVWVQVGLR